MSALADPTAFERAGSLERLSGERFDILVIGGGVTGCGVALDAAARGLRTALVDAGDFAGGTSSRSSKLVHGGLRYLQQHDYLLVYEALHERQRLLRNAPHLVRPLPFLIPLFGRAGVLSKGLSRAYSSALWLYDVTGGVRIGHRHRRVSASEALEHFPMLRTDRLVASFLYWDAQADDARLTLALARTAATLGAVVANYCPVDEIVEEAGRVMGARLAGGGEVRAEAVVNATGVWSQHVAGLAGGSRGAVSIRPAKGIHVTVPSERLPCDYAAVLTVPGDRRSVFVVPWDAAMAPPSPASGRFTYIGTTDTDYEGPLDRPLCTPEDIGYCLGAVNAWTSADLTPADVTGSWAGLRPLVSDARSARTADLSRRHQVVVSPNGLVTVTGGKLTTYRRMASDTVDAVLALHRPASAGTAARIVASVHSAAGRDRSPTRRLTLVGGDGGGRPGAAATRAAAELGLDEVRLGHLAARYGSETAAVLELCGGDPELSRPLVPGLPYLRVEVLWAVRREMAITLSDVLARRMRALILDREASAAAAADVGHLMAAEMGWDRPQLDSQIQAFLEEVDAERRAETGPGPVPW